MAGLGRVGVVGVGLMTSAYVLAGLATSAYVLAGLAIGGQKTTSPHEMFEIITFYKLPSIQVQESGV